MYLFLQKDDKKVIIRQLDAYSILFHPNVGSNFTISPSDFEDRLLKFFDDGYVDVTNDHYAYFVKEGESDVVMMDESDFSQEFLKIIKNGPTYSNSRTEWKNAYDKYIESGYTDISSRNDSLVNNTVVPQSQDNNPQFPVLDQTPRAPYGSFDMADRLLNDKGFSDPIVWRR